MVLLRSHSLYHTNFVNHTRLWGEVRSLPLPLDIRAHSTKMLTSSQALFRGVPLEDICMAAGWSSPCTFVRFYNLDVNTAPGSQVLSAWASCVFVFWSVKGQAWQCVSLACVVYRSQCVKLRSVTYERNVSGYLHNPCSLIREQGAVSAAKLLLLSICFFDRKIWGVRWHERRSMSNMYDVGAVSLAISQWIQRSGQ